MDTPKAEKQHMTEQIRTPIAARPHLSETTVTAGFAIAAVARMVPPPI